MPFLAIIFCLFSFLFQNIQNSGIDQGGKTIEISYRQIINVIILSPILESSMVGGIYAISRLIKIKTHSDTIFIVFSILYWPLIHNYYNYMNFYGTLLGLALFH